ncbi:MAG: hypothetical protein QM742_06115 [Aquabacterium sp.]
MTARTPLRRVAAAALGLALPALLTLWSGQAEAVPSYARQTGQDCVACHIGGFGPQLTPFGIKFKLGGYVDSDGKDGKIPLSGMVVADYSRWRDESGKHTDKTDLAEASLFLAGKFTDHIGSFVQVTHDGVEHHTSIDQADIRYARTLNVAGQDALFGLSLNNNPTVQDPFNTLAVWGFPYTDSPRGNAVGAEFAGIGGTELKVLGVNAYTVLHDNFYGELGLYNSLSRGTQSRLGLGSDDTDHMRNAPYWRLAYMVDQRTQAWNVGVFGYNGTMKDRSSGDISNRFKDLGIDGSYQFLGNRQHIVTVNGSYIRERTITPEGGEDVRNTVKDARLAASYHFMNTYGATLGYFKAQSANNESGNRGFIYQLDWTPWGKESSWMAPWANVRVGLQYVAYKKYIDFDEDTETATVVAKPSDKNTLNLFVWASF